MWEAVSIDVLFLVKLNTDCWSRRLIAWFSDVMVANDNDLLLPRWAKILPAWLAMKNWLKVLLGSGNSESSATAKQLWTKYLLV